MSKCMCIRVCVPQVSAARAFAAHRWAGGGCAHAPLAPHAPHAPRHPPDHAHHPHHPLLMDPVWGETLPSNYTTLPTH